MSSGSLPDSDSSLTDMKSSVTQRSFVVRPSGLGTHTDGNWSPTNSGSLWVLPQQRLADSALYGEKELQLSLTAGIRTMSAMCLVEKMGWARFYALTARAMF